MYPRAFRRASLFFSLAALVASCAPDERAPEPLAQAALPVQTFGDWALYGDGQCVIGAQKFYKAKFGVTLKATGVQGSSIGACAYLGACMYWVSDAARPDPATWERYDWGSVMPQTYDLIIYPPTGSNPYGHVASVDHMEGPDKASNKNLYVMDSNYGNNEQKASAIHTVSTTPYGFYRLKSLISCSAQCSGNAVVDDKCHKTECGGASCVHDDLGPRCVHPACPAKGDATGCDGPGSVVSCHDGSISGREDCTDGRACSSVGGEARCDAPPRGYLDSVGCETIKGWSQDPSKADQPIDVHLYFGGPAGDAAAVGLATRADVERADLCDAIQSCNHGFAFPTPRSLLDGKPHAVHGYGIDASGGPNAELKSSPGSLSCPTPPLPPASSLRKVGPSLDAWRFSPFQDVAPAVDDADRFSPLAERGPDLPDKPRFVRADDGSTDLWLIDGDLRRRLPASAATAWHVEAPETWPAPELYQLEAGPDLHPRPRLVQSTGPTFWLIDEREADPSPSSPSKPSTPAGAAPTGATPAGSLPGSAAVNAGSSEREAGCSQAPRPAGAAPWAAGLALLLALRLRRRPS